MTDCLIKFKGIRVLRLTVSRPVCFNDRNSFGPDTRFVLRVLSDSCAFVAVWWTHWRGDGFALYNYCWTSPELSFSDPNPRWTCHHIVTYILVAKRRFCKNHPFPCNALTQQYESCHDTWHVQFCCVSPAEYACAMMSHSNRKGDKGDVPCGSARRLHRIWPDRPWSVWTSSECSAVEGSGAEC
jgi:hypothetical protein